MQPVHLPKLVIATAMALSLIAGCSSTQGMGTLEKPTWDYLNTVGAGTSGEAFTLADFQPVDDTLYAIPLKTTVKAGDPVRIVVVTGVPFHNFSYMNGVAVTAPASSGYDYVRRSFNVGAVGGSQWAMDGFWSAITDREILSFPDKFIATTTGQGQRIIDFNVTPIGYGADVQGASGVLFNFEATFSKPGVYAIGFLESDFVDRTYYNDSNLYPHFLWGDVTNQHSGVPNSITVTDAEGNLPASSTVVSR
jgi:hypothetical protein